MAWTGQASAPSREPELRKATSQAPSQEAGGQAHSADQPPQSDLPAERVPPGGRAHQ
jgi:hypothetical protein